jgi:hypothetical protein
MLEGRARVSGADVREMTRKLSAKYVKLEELDNYVDSALKQAMVVIRVTPKRIVAWDYSKSIRLSYLNQS